MSKICIVLSITICLLYGKNSVAQQAEIRGIVTDSSGSIIVATVSLLNSKDSSWIRSELADDKGNFLLTNVAPGDYLVSVTSVGYKSTLQSVTLKDSSVRKINIILQKENASLKEVTITGKKAFIEMGLGKVILNVDASATNIGTNVLELLRRSPGITVDQAGNISMQGKQGVQVLIDNRPTHLSGDQLADYLKSLSSDDVAQLELITQPSAQYDAAGNAGIINIKRKKSKKQGLNGSATLTAAQGIYPYGSGSMLLNYRKNKLNISLSGSELKGTGFAYWTESQQLIDPTTNKTSTTTQINSSSKEHFSIANLRLIADYDLTDKSSFGVSAMAGYHTNSYVDNVYSGTFDAQNNTNTYSTTLSPGGFIREDIAANAYFSYKFNTEKTLNLNFNYLVYSNSPYQDITSTDFNAQMQPLPDPLILQSHQPTQINVYSLKADYTDTLTNGIKLEAGFKSSLVYTDNNALFNIYQNNTWMVDTTRTNRFLYTENINALYISAGKSFGDKWETRAGLRAENTNAQGIQQVHNEQFTKSYISLFPTAYINYKANKDNQFELNYGRRIDRPPYQSLNPFIFYSFQYNYSVGNPYLQPQYTNRVELKHSYKNMLITTLGVSGTAGEISNILDVNSATGVVYSTQENVASDKTIDLSVIFNKDLFKWWSLNLSGVVYYETFNGIADSAAIHSQGFGSAFNMTHQFNLGKGWSVELLTYYVGRSVQSIIATAAPVTFISVAATKKINETSTIKLSADDPFYIYRNGEQNTLPGFQTNAVFRYNTRAAVIAYTYTFGHSQSKNHVINAPDETKRVKMD